MGPVFDSRLMQIFVCFPLDRHYFQIDIISPIVFWIGTIKIKSLQAFVLDMSSTQLRVDLTDLTRIGTVLVLAMLFSTVHLKTPCSNRSLHVPVVESYKFSYCACSLAGHPVIT